jgi:hypothetical protein
MNCDGPTVQRQKKEELRTKRYRTAPDQEEEDQESSWAHAKRALGGRQGPAFFRKWFALHILDHNAGEALQSALTFTSN